MKHILFLISCLVLVGGVNSALAARQPDQVEKSFVFTGKLALEAAQLLGFDTSQFRQREFSWGRSEAMCFKGQGKDGKPRIEPCDDSPTKKNSATFSPGSTPKLVLKGTWWDRQTGVGKDVPRYAFSSRIPMREFPQDEWGRLLKHIGIRSGQPDNTKLKSQTHSTSKKLSPLLEIDVRPAHGNDRLIIEIAVDEDAPSKRVQKVSAYQACLRSLREKARSGGASESGGC